MPNRNTVYFLKYFESLTSERKLYPSEWRRRRGCTKELPHLLDTTYKRDVRDGRRGREGGQGEEEGQQEIFTRRRHRNCGATRRFQ